jgi:hypothetical protein
MTAEQEQKLQEMARKDYEARHGDRLVGDCGTQAKSGMVGRSAESSERLSYRAQIQNHLDSAKSHARRAEVLSELLELLDKHPEISRMFDLMEEAKDC